MDIKQAIEESVQELLKEHGKFSVWKITKDINAKCQIVDIYVNGRTIEKIYHRDLKIIFDSMQFPSLKCFTETNQNGAEYRVFCERDATKSFNSKIQQTQITHALPPFDEIKNYIMKNGNKTLKQIQSRFKKYKVTCSELFAHLSHNGANVIVSSRSISKAIMNKE